MQKRLTRSRTNKMIAGICGGLGEYLDVDPTIVRVVFIALVLANGMGLLAYVAMWLIVPEEGETAAPATAETAKAGAEPAVIAGVVLIVLGAFFMLQNLNVWWLGWVTGKVLWPAVIIAIGLVLLLRRGKGA